jgi:hypothetical protein
MTVNKFKYKVKVHTMDGKYPKLNEVRLEKDFDSAYEAQCYIARFNEKCVNDAGRQVAQAVYSGKYDVRTGELV